MKFTTTTILATIVALAIAAPTPYIDSVDKEIGGNPAVVPRNPEPIDAAYSGNRAVGSKVGPTRGCLKHDHCPTGGI
ncbi:hypothetical protein Ptr902_03506 [Pyrenophora tritici-repentis]|nr:hypothetical protein Ptr902_03506 [Pyrenophora tritici-repentis]